MNKDAKKISRLAIQAKRRMINMSEQGRSAVQKRWTDEMTRDHGYREIIVNGVSQCGECEVKEKWKPLHFWLCEEHGIAGNGEKNCIECNK